MTRYRFLLSGFAGAALLPGLVYAQSSFDNSGNSLLQGTYFIRQVLNGHLSRLRQIGEAVSLAGTVTFSGGAYTLNGQVSDTTVSVGAPQPLTASGNYSVNASGMFVMDNPLSAGDYIYGGVGPSAITGSSTESGFFDFMVAVPVGSSVTNASLTGTYRMVGMDYHNGNVNEVSNYTFLIKPDGQGNLNVASLSGHAATVSNNLFSQSISGATYSLSGVTGTLTFPAQSSGTSLISGTKQFFLSADGNILVAGSLDGYDIQVGINVAGAAASASFNGTYFSAGEDFGSSPFGADDILYAYFGSAHATTTGGSTTVVADQRINSDAIIPYDLTFTDQFALASDGSATEPLALYFVGAGGAARVLAGQSTQYSIELDMQAQPLAVSGSVILNPLGVLNAANYLPITNPVTPGELLSLFGSGLGPVSVAKASLPYPNTLAGVSVSIDGIAAPVQSVSDGQINCIVPYEIAGDSFAVVRVTNNGVLSNTVTLYNDFSAPGVFTLDGSGTGDAAALHSDGSIVNAGDPAQVGETIALYATGLGALMAGAQDGVGASSTSLTNTVDTFEVYVDDVEATVTFSGLAPGFAGLYQLNFVVPSVPDAGPLELDVEDTVTEAYNSIAVLEVSATASSARPKVLHTGPGERARTRGARSRGGIRSIADVTPNRREPGFSRLPIQ
jgi:uncharacterized protein (TIGR03437 family)